MTALPAAGAGIRVEAPPQTGPIWWTPLLACVLLGAGVVVLLLRAAPATDGRRTAAWRRPADGLAAVTGLPAWAAGGIAVSLWSLVSAVLGFTWDVAWHADLGRDQALFTPPHTMILVGLSGIGLAACTAIALATADRAEVGLAAGRLRIPWSAMPMGLMGLGAVIGFPLDDYWHSVYGIDVTMWSPTHLLMIGGAALTPIATWLMFAEANVAPRNRVASWLNESLATSVLIGLSAFQLEFDLGIPQWQALYQPCLIAVAMGVGLVAAREALGPGGALRATVGFLVTRAGIALLVGPVFGLSVERFPLYLGGALCVELVYLAGPRLGNLSKVLLTGLLLGTAGLALEWWWTHAWGLTPWQPRLLASWWVVLGLALSGAILGAALGRAVAHAPHVLTVSRVAVAFVVLAALLAVPYPRHGSPVQATISAAPAGERVPVITREGLVSSEQPITVNVTISPADGADGADVFWVNAWQGGQIITRTLHPAGGGRYTIDASIPTGGTWKSLVMFEKGDVVAAVPVDFPADGQYGLPAIPAPVDAPRTAAFSPASTYLTRESHGGSALPAILAYTTLGIIAVVWGAALLGVGDALRRRLRAALSAPRFVGGTR